MHVAARSSSWRLGPDSSKRKSKGVSGEAAWREGLCGGDVCDVDRRRGETGETQAPVCPTLGQGVAGRGRQGERREHPGSIPLGSQVSLGTREKRPESLPGKRQRVAAVEDERGAMGEPQLAAGEPRGDSAQEAREVGQSPGGRLGSASRQGLGGVQGAPGVSQVPAPQLSGDSAEETGEVCQGPGAPGGLRSASRRPLRGVQGGDDMAASGGSAGSGPQSRGYSSEETGEVCQVPGALGRLRSASRRPLRGVQGGDEMASGGSAGSGPQSRGYSSEETGEVCQVPGAPCGLPSASRRPL
uniref:Uncharacterized protein n=1 Tax=Rangifer tarandus platyrhynchus TaxID=3082113 RepID=A0ACB0EH31_RANTA|nr:unnamed protein product [Rangifer tarandus platyrhynchus]